ncbi:DNA mismatch repair protein MutS [Gordonia sp. TBRC 11910]|uniref:DNA mismatch repair protein MutS n=1 Tax=Gordonia asplenii TaxID=2725283 RepID=A0A848L130_9ACTN|nr:DNA mismatch repair protein MutS [Gordonia asplenii]NMO04496.1 DNA mismatch repair protein MutS [Gordonia asplenii]
MKVRLMYRDADFDPEDVEIPFAGDLARDLQLEHLWDALSGGDSFVRHVARCATLQPLDDPDVIDYRQRACHDALRNPDAVLRLYALTVDALVLRRKIFLLPVSGNPQMELSFAVRMMSGFADIFARMTDLAAEVAGRFESAAFRGLWDTVTRELDDDYLRMLRKTLSELDFPDGMLMSAGIGLGGAVVDQWAKQPRRVRKRLHTRIALTRPSFSFTLPERDDAGADALMRLRQRGLNDIANAATQSVEHVLSFFTALRTELAFYLACTNLAARLREIGSPVTFPMLDADEVAADGLYDPCLAVTVGRAPVGNSVELARGSLLIITGANRGGKSTMLRALGVAQLMAQSGMFVAAQRFRAPVARRVLTHWTRDEDVELVHGKFDDELERMEQIISIIAPRDLLLCNETFASTNEIEGSEILFEITQPLVGNEIRLYIVTHLFDFAYRASSAPDLDVVFLRAPRRGTDDDFQLRPGPPSPTSYGMDYYDQVFGTHYSER